MSAYSDLILAHGSLVVYYRLGEGSGTTLDDVGPNNLDGTYAGSGITYGAGGAIVNDANTAITLDASTDAATVPDNNALDLGDGPFSVEVWVNRDRTATNETLLNKGGSAGAGAYQLRINSGDRIELLRSGSTYVARTAASALTDTSGWHHIVGTRGSGGGAAAKVYLDGVDVTADTQSQTFSDTALVLRIAHQAANTQRFQGSLDDLAVYAAELSPDEVLLHYRVGRALLTPATETDSAVALDKDKSSTVGVSSETDSAQALDVDKTKALTSAAETDGAQALTPSKAPTLGVAAETDVAQALSFTKTIFKSITPAVETDAAGAFTAAKSVSLTSSSETDAAEALDADKQATLGVASETDTAGVLSRTGYIVPADETDEAQALSYSVTSPSGGGGIEFRPKPRRPLKVAQLWPIWPAYERDTAVELTYTKKPSQIQLEDDELLLLV